MKNKSNLPSKTEMSYSQQQLENIIIKSVAILLKERPNLLKRNYDINERTICSKLACIIEKHIKNYHVDTEYNRMTDEQNNQIIKKIPSRGNKKKRPAYPDIVIHREEDALHNLLVIELKLAWKNKGKKKDIEKIKAYLKVLNYQYGLYIELNENGIECFEWV